MPRFERYLGIDYSGAQTPVSGLTGLRVYGATPAEPPREIRPPPGARKHWTRRGLAEWLASELAAGPVTLVGIDHAFSFPLRYFEKHRLAPAWPAFLDDFQTHWPTDGEHVYVDFVRHGLVGSGAARSGSARWRRLAEERCRAKSAFHFDVPGSVAKSTHAGLPWLRYLREQPGAPRHFWPFDGWRPTAGVSVLAEVYPALWNRSHPIEGSNGHQHDARSVARWLRETDAAGALGGHFEPSLSPAERTRAQIEGWIFGLG